MFLIVTSKRDITADFVVLELQRRALPYLRLNTEDLPRATIIYRPTNGGAWTMEIEGARVELSSVRAAYFRRPGIPVPMAQVQDDAERAYCIQEWSAVLTALYWELGDRWLNAPYLIALAENKIRQLRLASEVGLQVPETAITNDADFAKSFAGKGEVVGKPLRAALIGSGDMDRVIFTTRLSPQALADFRSIQACPMILQSEIRKAFDIRVTVVGDQTFAAAIDSQSDPETQVDWRVGSKADLAHAVHELPCDVHQMCIEVVRQLGLRFGAIDLVLDIAGTYWFLEVNPNGQWGWIEKRTGQPIASAIVTELERIAA